MDIPVMTPDMLIVFCLLSLAIILFVFEWLRVDLVGLLMMVLLPLSGVISPEDAVAGLSSNAVVSIIAVMILGAGLNKTGIMHVVAAKIIDIAGRDERRIMVVVSATVAIISSFMQNIGAAALFLPATMRICRQLNFSASRLLMPMGFCAITGGCLTLVGSSPLIMLNDLMGSWWQNNQALLGNQEFTPLSLLSVTPIGAILLLGMLAYFIIFAKRLLPLDACSIDSDNMDQRLKQIYGSEVGRGFEVLVPSKFPPTSLKDLHLRPRYHMTVVGIFEINTGKKNITPMQESLVGPGDTLSVICSEANIKKAAEEHGWKVRPEHEIFSAENSPEECGVIEGVVVPHSNLAGHSMQELQFREMFQLNPLAIVRQDQIIMEHINIRKLAQGDALLLHGKWNQFKLLQKQMDIAFLEDIKGEDITPERTRCVLFFLLLSLVLALSFQVKLSIALLTGALGIIITGVIRADRAYEAVDWRTIFLLAGLIPLGTAFENTGAAAWLAANILNMVGAPSSLFLLAIISIMTAFFSLMASNVGAAVLMVPISMNLAAKSGFDPVIAAMVVALSASNTFLLPTHQVNALIMRPGGYRTLDYLKAGVGATVLFTSLLIGTLALYGI